MKSLERRLGLWSVVIITISSLLGGVFVLPGLAVSMTGSSAWLAYLAVALCVLPAALAKCELASALPKSGGTYVYINQAFGPLAGTVMGLGLWASLALKSAFALVGFSAYLYVLQKDVSEIKVALGLLCIITALNLRGVKKVSQVQGVVVAIAFGGLATLLLISLPAMDPQKVAPFLTTGPIGFGETVAFLFVSYAGLTKIAAIAGEVKNPGRNIPLGIFISILIITPLFCLVVIALDGNIPIEQLHDNIRPIHTLAEVTIGPIGGVIAALIAVLAMTSMANAGLLASSRFPFAMSRDGLVPPLFGLISPRFLTPFASIICTSFIMACAIAFIDISGIIKLASAFKIIAFASTNTSLMVLRESKAQWYKPEYKSPLYPWLQIFGLVVCIILLSSMGQIALLAILGILLPGIFLYLVYGRKRTSKRGVLGKMTKRSDLTTKEPDAVGVEEVVSGHTSAIIACIDKELAVETLTHVGTALSERKRVEVLHITEVADSIALDEVLEEDPGVRSMRRRVTSMREMATIDVKFLPMVSHDVVATVHALSSKLHSDWLVMTWKPYRFFNPLGWLYNHLPNDLALFKNSGIRYIRRILVLAQPTTSQDMLAEAAHNLSLYYKATITFVLFVHDSSEQSEVDSAQDALVNIQNLCSSKSESLILRGTSKIESLVEASEDHDLFIVGSPPHSRLNNVFFRTEEDEIAAKAVCSVLILKSPRTGPRPRHPQPNSQNY